MNALDIEDGLETIRKAMDAARDKLASTSLLSTATAWAAHSLCAPRVRFPN